jgi:PIN domain nuclease of toxin-antitoxin system
VGSGSLTLLLDTHILIWLAEGSRELSEPSVARLETAARETGLAVSAISFWEVAMLHRRQRIPLSLPVNAWRDIVLETPGFVEAPLGGDVAIESFSLPAELDSRPG